MANLVSFPWKLSNSTTQHLSMQLLVMQNYERFFHSLRIIEEKPTFTVSSLLSGRALNGTKFKAEFYIQYMNQ